MTVFTHANFSSLYRNIVPEIDKLHYALFCFTNKAADNEKKILVSSITFLQSYAVNKSQWKTLPDSW